MARLEFEELLLPCVYARISKTYLRCGMPHCILQAISDDCLPGVLISSGMSWFYGHLLRFPSPSHDAHGPDETAGQYIPYPCVNVSHRNTSSCGGTHTEIGLIRHRSAQSPHTGEQLDDVVFAAQFMSVCISPQPHGLLRACHAYSNTTHWPCIPSAQRTITFCLLCGLTHGASFLSQDCVFFMSSLSACWLDCGLSALAPASGLDCHRSSWLAAYHAVPARQAACWMRWDAPRDGASLACRLYVKRMNLPS